jgi:hypothetical protein
VQGDYEIAFRTILRFADGRELPVRAKLFGENSQKVVVRGEKNRYAKAMCRRLCFRCGSRLICQRSIRVYCTNACRQSAYRRRHSPRVRHCRVMPKVPRQERSDG